MALNIKNRETEALIRELAAHTGESISLAMKRAATERLNRVKNSEDATNKRRDLLAMVLSWPDPPKGLTREQIDAEMYDEYGLPR
ncbi:type II toxin-antitoxin system VapB family antitoxin [Pacificimonas sp. WHA3]|uniref:Type II toxin-antitoxin system VapB family antitoxin n=1 Tax=Pacificimonas pallii TaxID=2827236 RepID=A0ABS6SAR8_9SPHN|nr:type II toxin-antitoxin system VapB family antitoxin [Pacificimonas pallii]MBV7255500.1 type II toxin-antitoxin system VapB family antitoxin [Pacificimonas pallii]